MSFVRSVISPISDALAATLPTLMSLPRQLVAMDAWKAQPCLRSSPWPLGPWSPVPGSRVDLDVVKTSRPSLSLVSCSHCFFSLFSVYHHHPSISSMPHYCYMWTILGWSILAVTMVEEKVQGEVHRWLLLLPMLLIFSVTCVRSMRSPIGHLSPLPMSLKPGRTHKR